MSQADFRHILHERALASPLIDSAIEQAEQSHASQLRDNGNSYLTEHIYPVASEVITSYGELSAPASVIAAAILHDSIEDDPTFTYERCKDQFGTTIADIVQALTKNDEENAPSNNQQEKARLNHAYMRRLANGPPEAMRIKLADRFCNLATISTIKTTNPGKYNRYISETKDLFLPLAKVHSAYFYAQLKDLLDDLEKAKI